VATPTNQSKQNVTKKKIASRRRADFLSRATNLIQNKIIIPQILLVTGF